MNGIKKLCVVLASIIGLDKNHTNILVALFNAAQFSEEQSYCYIAPNNIADRIVEYLVARGQWKKCSKGLRLSTLFRILIYYNILIPKPGIYIFNTEIFGHHDWRNDDNFTLTFHISDGDVIFAPTENC